MADEGRAKFSSRKVPTGDGYLDSARVTQQNRETIGRGTAPWPSTGKAVTGTGDNASKYLDYPFTGINVIAAIPSFCMISLRRTRAVLTHYRV
jgi:hypothetical protein